MAVDPKREFWQAQHADARGMMLNDAASDFDAAERTELIARLPDLRGADVLELGAGVGRYTRHFAETARSVVAVDFVEAFIEENRRATADAPARVEHHCTDAMRFELHDGAVDLVFVNWLLMYLEDDQAGELLDRVHRWLRPGGTFFLRESCFSASNPDAPHPNTHYRDDTFYEAALSARFEIVASGNVAVYEQRLRNPNQLFWIAGRA